MAVSTETSKNIYDGDGTTADLPYDFRVLDQTEIEATETIGGADRLLAIGVDYTVTGVGNDAGGSVVRLAGNLPTGTRWTIRRRPPLTQTMSLTRLGKIDPLGLTRAFDRAVMLVQLVWDEARRALRIPVGETVDTTLPAAADRARQALYFDAEGRPVVHFLDPALRAGSIQAFDSNGDPTYLHARITETPSGIVDGVNRVFRLSQAPYNGTIDFRVNGTRIDAADYTIDDVTVTLDTAPAFTSTPSVGYWVVPIQPTGGVAWGGIIGNLRDQVDLTAALDEKEAAGSAATAVSAHVAATDPHPGYRLESVAVPWADLSGVPSTFAPSAHGHAVGDLTQSGATTGQAPVWNGTAWVPADVASTVTLAANREINSTKPLSSADTRARFPWLVNLLANPDGAEVTTGWTPYADAAGVLPVDGVGGSPTVTVTRTAAGLRTPYSLTFNKPSGNCQGQGMSTGTEVLGSLAPLSGGIIPDGADIGRTLSVSGLIKIDGTYVAGDLKWCILDATSLAVVASASVDASGRFAFYFSPVAGTSYEQCLHVASTSTAAYTAALADLVVGPAWVWTGPAATEEQDGGAIVITATGTSPTKGTTTKDKVRWARSADRGFYRYNYGQSSLGSAGSGDALFSLPAGQSFDSTKVSFYTGSIPRDSDLIPGGFFSGVGGVYFPGPAFIVPYDATRFRIYFIFVNTSYQTGASFFGAAGFANADIGFSLEFSAPIAGWSGTQAVQPGGRFRLFERLGAGTRVTGRDPNALGEWRWRIGGTDTAPSIAPSAANGFCMYISASSISQLDAFIGPGKSWAMEAFASTGRTGVLLSDVFYNTTTGLFYGIFKSYDPKTGIATFISRDAVGLTAALASVSSCYLDPVISDDPVPVALAPSVHVEASSDAGQVVSTTSTDIQYEDEVVDTHGAWSGTVFTAPVAGDYFVAFNFAPNTVMNATPQIYRNGALYVAGPICLATGGNNAGFSCSMRLFAGDTIRFRTGNPYTANGGADRNWCRITCIGDA